MMVVPVDQLDSKYGDRHCFQVPNLGGFSVGRKPGARVIAVSLLFFVNETVSCSIHVLIHRSLSHMFLY